MLLWTGKTRALEQNCFEIRKRNATEAHVLCSKFDDFVLHCVTFHTAGKLNGKSLHTGQSTGTVLYAP